MISPDTPPGTEVVCVDAGPGRYGDGGLQRGEHARVVAAGVLPEHEDRVGQFKVGERHRPLAHAELLAHLRAWLEPGDCVLLKASHSVGLERIVAQLLADAAPDRSR